jgi:hypothetical protein
MTGGLKNAQKNVHKCTEKCAMHLKRINFVPKSVVTRIIFRRYSVYQLTCYIFERKYQTVLFHLCPLSPLFQICMILSATCSGVSCSVSIS